MCDQIKSPAATFCHLNGVFAYKHIFDFDCNMMEMGHESRGATLSPNRTLLDCGPRRTGLNTPALEIKSKSDSQERKCECGKEGSSSLRVSLSPEEFRYGIKKLLFLYSSCLLSSSRGGL